MLIEVSSNNGSKKRNKHGVASEMPYKGKNK